MARSTASLALLGAATLLSACEPVPPDPCAVAADCPAGLRLWEPGGECLPLEPCAGNTACRAEGRVCAIDSGRPSCGRCLDGFVADGAECVRDESDDFVGPFRVGADWFSVWDGTRYRHLFLRGMNVGGSLPGEAGSQSSLTEAQWLAWMALWGDAGINVVRVYGLHPPGLYRALVTWNAANPERPIYLLQGVYLRDDEIELLHDLHDRSALFDADVARAIDCVHGACDDPEYPDASSHTIGWLLGREVLAGEAIATDEAHPDDRSYVGAALSIADATPSAVWVVERLDRAVVHERTTYGVERPIAFSNWLELDPLTHPTETERRQQDRVAIDLEPVDDSLAPAGHFISYHVYPYFPSFLHEDPIYRLYEDAEGPNSYRAILQDLRIHHPDTTMLIAEFGVPSSWGRAHESPSGMHHGGLDEREQGEAGVRMFRDIEEMGYAGGVWFQWEDGWWKTSWIARLRAFPFDRNSLWHDLMNPEQSYGLLAFVPPMGPTETIFEAPEGPVRRVAARTSVEVLELDVELDAALEAGAVLEIGLDVLDRERGERTLPMGGELDVGAEVALVVQDDGSSQVFVTGCLDMRDHGELEDRAPLRTGAPGCDGWAPVEWIWDFAHTTPQGCQYPHAVFPLGALRGRREGEPASSLDAIVIDDATLHVRLPWNLISFSDPSTRSVLNDDRSTRGLDAAATDGVVVVVDAGGEPIQTDLVTWATWDEPPVVTERLKESAEILFAHLRAMPRFID